MELVEGEDLSQRLARGAVPIDEALAIARQVADALEAAHEQGVVHRDLKPANIKLRPDGTVKVLDFGLANLGAPGAVGSADAQGALGELGTPLTCRRSRPAQVADRRSDIWAFGCVLFELVTGRRAFTGDEVTDLIVAVVSREPDWSALPADLPEPIARLIKRCLTKDVRARLPHMGAARLEIEEVLRAPLTPSGPRSSAAMTTAERPARSGWLRWAVPLGALLVGTAIGTVATRGTPTPVAEPPAVTRLMLAPTSEHALTVSGNDRDVAISRDGRRIVYVGGNGTALFVQDLDKREPVRIDVRGLPHHPTPLARRAVDLVPRWLERAQARARRRWSGADHRRNLVAGRRAHLGRRWHDRHRAVWIAGACLLKAASRGSLPDSEQGGRRAAGRHAMVPSGR